MLTTETIIRRENAKVTCPCCANEIAIGVEFQEPRLVTLVPSSEVAKAKDQLKAALSLITELAGPEKDAVFAQVDSQENVIVPADVEIIVENFKAKYAAQAKAVEA